MNNTLAILLAVAIVAAVIADQLMLGGAGALFLGKKLLDLMTTIAFWR